MHKFLTLSALVGFFALTGSAATIYGAADNNFLYTINPTNGVLTQVGNNMGINMYDIADFGGKLYGIDSQSELYSINTTTAQVTAIGQTGQQFNALTFSSTGVLYAAGIGETTLYTINLGSGHATAVPGGNGSAYNSAGDLAFFGDTLYLTTQNGGNSILDTVNIATGALTVVGNTGFTNVFGLVASGGVLYGFTDNDGSSKVLSIKTSSGAGQGGGTVVASYGGTGGNGFGFDGTATDTAPEPGTLGVMGLGLVGLGAFARRRRIAK
jgi:hypothetical protein